MRCVRIAGCEGGAQSLQLASDTAAVDTRDAAGNLGGAAGEGQ